MEIPKGYRLLEKGEIFDDFIDTELCICGHSKLDHSEGVIVGKMHCDLCMCTKFTRKYFLKKVEQKEE